MLYFYKVEVLRVVDGDTVDVMIDLGFRVWVKNRLRLWGIDAPETRTRDLDEKRLGLETKAYLEEQLVTAEGDGREIRIESKGLDKYGRSLAVIWVQRDDGTFFDLNQNMVDNNLAMEYMRD